MSGFYDRLPEVGNPTPQPELLGTLGNIIIDQQQLLARAEVNSESVDVLAGACLTAPGGEASSHEESYGVSLQRYTRGGVEYYRIDIAQGTTISGQDGMAGL